MTLFKTILLTTDLSPASNAAFQFALELARRTGAKLYLLHVFDNTLFFSNAVGETLDTLNPDWLEIARGGQQRKIDELARQLADERVETIHLMKSGRPATEIVHFAKSIHADCIVIATHGRTGAAKLLLGSVAEEVVRTAPCAVLTVRPTDEEINSAAKA